MKKLLPLLLFFVICFTKLHSQNIAINATGSLPDTSAMLDVSSVTKGFLVPRMTSAQKSAIPLPASGLLIYQTDGATGFWYYTGSTWSPLSNVNWLTTGNASTIDSSNFIGTTDNVPFNIKVNNQKAGRITSTGNTMFGYKAGNVNTATSNTALGYQALMADTSGDYNTALGTNAMVGNLSGGYNTSTGVNSLYSNTTGSYNTSSGVFSMIYNTTGSFNTAIGMQALYSNNTGDSNTAVGLNSLYFNTSGSYNTAVGLYASISNTSGYNNTAIGYQSLYANTTGSGNVGIGYNTLLNNSTGSFNTIIGDSADVAVNNLRNATAIGNKAIVACDSCLVLGDTTLKAVGIGTKLPTSDLSFGGRLARTIRMERHTASNTAGNNLTLQAGGASSGATDKNGGDMNVSSGIATGTGSSNVYIQTVSAGTTGTTDRLPTTKVTVLGSGNMGIGTTPTAVLHIKAGTTTASSAPVKVDDGIVLGTIEKGTIEKDANVFYITPDATNRGLLPSTIYNVSSSDFTLTNGAGAQSPFAASQDVVNVAASTTYEFEAQYLLSTGTTLTRTISTLFGGTATLTNIAYTAELSTGAANTMTTTISRINVNVATAKVLDATNTNAEAVITLKGIVRVNTAGTLIPQIQFSAAPGGTNKCLLNSFFKLTPIGTNTATIIGSWN